MKDFEEILSKVGSFGPYQIRTFFITHSMEFWAAMAMMLPVFTGAKPEMTCANGTSATETEYMHSNTSLTLTTDICQKDDTVCPNLTYSHEFTSIITEWTLVCGRSFVSDLITTIQMVGVLLGAFIVGQLADLFGRKKVLYADFTLMIVFGFSSALAYSWPVYAALRFFLGGTLGGLLVVSVILPIEICSPRWRTLGSCLGFWGIGVAFLALLGNLLRDWRHLTMASTAPGLMILATWWWFPESPRWLLMQDRINEATNVITDIAKFNRRPQPDLTGLAAFAKKERENEASSRHYSYWHLFKTRRMARITLLAMYAWFTCTTVYYGINLNMKNLSTDRYINVMLSGLVEMPALIFVILVNDRAGRRWTSSGSLMLGSLAMFSILIIDVTGKLDLLPDVVLVIVMLGKTAISAGWTAMIILSAESFPTVTRNIGYGACSVAGRVGGIVAPQIVFLNEISRPLPYIVFGIIGVVASIAALFLPETSHFPLRDGFKRTDPANCDALPTDSRNELIVETPDESRL